MGRVAFQLVGPSPLAPWRSPLLRWRMETYGIVGADGHLLHADEITPPLFWQFVCHHRHALVRFLWWAASL